MADKYEELLANLELRMRQLMFLCDSLREENSTLKSQLVVKNEKINNLSSDLEQLKSSYDNLKFARNFLTGNDEEKNVAKQRLSKLVQEVDKCISLLND